jgi:adenylate cyclase
VIYGFASLERDRVVERVCTLSEQLDEPASLLYGRIHLAAMNYPRGRPLRLIELLEPSLGLAERIGDRRYVAMVYLLLGLGTSAAGQFRTSERHFDRCAELDEAPGSPRVALGVALPLAPFDVRATMPALRCVVTHLMGRIREASELADRAARRFREATFGVTQAAVLANLADYRLYRREPEFAREFADTMAAIANERGVPEWLAGSRAIRALARMELGEVDLGIAEMEDAVREARSLGGTPVLAYWVTVLAGQYARRGRGPEAIRMIDEQLDAIARTGEFMHHAEMLRIKGEAIVLRDASATADAERCFRSAIDVARAQEAKWWELRATTSLARLLARTGRRDEARTMLSGIYQWFTDGFDLPDLKDAATLLEHLST